MLRVVLLARAGMESEPDVLKANVGAVTTLGSGSSTRLPWGMDCAHYAARRLDTA